MKCLIFRLLQSLIFGGALVAAPLLHADDHNKAASQVSKAPADARAYILSPKDGEKVGKTFTVRFGLSGMGIAPAGIDKESTGHHHLLIDVDQLPSMNKPLPATDNIIHFGGGQTETEITLSPGKHTLQLLLGNHLHIPHSNPVLSEKITVVVGE
ncbi:DUF4399 domain-containing protein [Microbulbifer sediminum]|uniref:DUF4399 domain-containing protein n=1 Tax=Microbulbifer sediminum TaxID=2904250 RepID=UPI001F2DCA97|nr:DUF4399 domain-containing protein [Microbulbifer sediminum]